MEKPILVTIPINCLYDDDCFFHLSDEAIEKAMAERLRIIAARAEIGDESEFEVDIELYAEAHIIHAVAPATGSRVSKRVSDGKLFIWYEDIPVLWSDNRRRFDMRLKWLDEQKKALNKEQDRLRQKSKTKKKNQEQEVEVRTLVAAH